MPGIDLHTHSTFSDGTLTPAQLVDTAVRLRLTALAIADHDTLDGQDEALRAGTAAGLRVVTAVELSVDHEDGSIHLLGYGFDPRHPDLRAAAENLRLSRETRNLEIIQRLRRMNYHLDPAQVRSLSPDGTWGRAHIAQALAQSAQVPSVDWAFQNLLQRGAPAYVERRRLALSNAVAVIHQAGGVAVWAHPGLLGERKMNALLERLPRWKDLGLDGVESDYHDHSLAVRDRLRALAERLGLIWTGGSDFHGGIKPDNRLGEGAAGLPVDESVLAALDRRVESVRNPLSPAV